jgi:thioredoxin-like negative regulator of GroEL
MSLTEVKTEAEYAAAVAAPVLTALHFLAPWAPECATVTAVLEELAREPALAGRLACLQLQAEDLPEISVRHEIVAVPTVLLFRAGKAVDRVDGVNAVELTKKVRSHALAVAAPAAPPAPKEDLNTKLKRLISAHKCMLFMKGKPDEPKCGFSRTTVGILAGLEADYGTFDILTDDEVASGWVQAD